VEEIRIMKKDFLSSLFLLLFGTFFTVESFKFGLGEWGRPGPGYFPFGAGLLFAIISLSVFVRTLRKAPSSETPIESSDRFHWQNIALVVVGLLAYALLLRKIGFALCTFGLVVFCIRVVARQGWFNSIMTGLIVAIVFHVFFNLLLNAQLPNGILGFVVG
jgi:hypothetical protein